MKGRQSRPSKAATSRMLVVLVAVALQAACVALELDEHIGTGAKQHRELQAPGSTSACDPAIQRLALLQLYNNTNGVSWTDSTGWPAANMSMSPLSLAQFAASTPVTTSTCMAAGAVLPDHCCWYGVQCCTPQTCASSSSQSCFACSCTSGLIVSLDLGMNNVSV